MIFLFDCIPSGFGGNHSCLSCLTPWLEAEVGFVILSYCTFVCTMLRLQSYNGIFSIFIAVIVIAELSLLLDFFLWSRYQMTQMRDDYAASLDDLIEEVHKTDDHREKNEMNHVILFVGVLNKLTLFERRRAIRSTWMSECDRLNVACKFFIDSINSLSGSNLTRMKDEISEHQDVIQMPFKSN